MTFTHQLARLRNAALPRPMRDRYLACNEPSELNRAVVSSGDLAELLHHFDRLDSQVRVAHRRLEDLGRYGCLSDVELTRLIRNCITNANGKLRREPAWHLVSEMLGVGSTTAADLCRIAQIDPDARAWAA
jgi:hypothetical protein